MRFGDVLAARREDVEHEPSAGLEELVNGGHGLSARVVGSEVEQRPEGRCDEGNTLVDRRRLEVAFAQIDEVSDTGRFRSLPAESEHPW